MRNLFNDGSIKMIPFFGLGDCFFIVVIVFYFIIIIYIIIIIIIIIIIKISS